LTDYLAGAMTTEAYLSQQLDYFPALLRLRQFATQPEYAGGKVLFVGEHRATWCPMDSLASDWFDTPAIVRMLSETEDNPSLVRRLQQEDVRLVLFNETELNKYYVPWFLLRFLSEDEAIALLRNAGNQGRTLNSREEREFVFRQASKSALLQRYERIMKGGEFLEPLWTKEGITIFRLKEGGERKSTGE